MGVPIKVGDFVRLTQNAQSLRDVSIEHLAGTYAIVTEPVYRSTGMEPASSLVWGGHPIDGGSWFVYSHLIYPAEPRHDPRDRCPKAKGIFLDHQPEDYYSRSGLSMAVCCRCHAYYISITTSGQWGWY
jgi:hypothetical protein